jgi:hypothetical protein
MFPALKHDLSMTFRQPTTAECDRRVVAPVSLAIPIQGRLVVICDLEFAIPAIGG